MKRLALIALLTPVLALQGCDLDGTDKVERDVDAFHSIAVGDGIDVTLHQGDHYAVSVKSDGGDLDSIKTIVEDDKLIITKTHGWVWLFTWWDMWSDYHVDVTLPSLGYLSNRGGASVKSDGELSGEALEVLASGGGSTNLKGRFKSITVRTSGGSDTRLAGSAQSFEARTSGGSSLRAMNLEVDDADLVASGGSSIGITVHDKLIARASGGSNIRYGGKPAQTDIQARGGADIIAK